jgi:hypothetical protein
MDLNMISIMIGLLRRVVAKFHHKHHMIQKINNNSKDKAQLVI